jgi:DNA-binding transcriptional regulator YdaS (Cro superfamily)
MDQTPATETPTGIAALDLACRLLGSQDSLADTLQIKSPSITGWRDRNRVPAERCREIEAATHGRVTRYQLRPDVFGPAPQPVQQAG